MGFLILLPQPHEGGNYRHHHCIWLHHYLSLSCSFSFLPVCLYVCVHGCGYECIECTCTCGTLTLMLTSTVFFLNHASTFLTTLPHPALRQGLSIRSKADRYCYSYWLSHPAGSLSLPSKTATTPTNISMAFYVGSGDPNSQCP